MSEHSFDFRPRVLVGLLRPVFFGLAVAAGVIAGERTDSFWIGLLAFLVAAAAGKALRRLLRGRYADAVHAALWPASASGYAILLVHLGLPNWAAVLVAVIAADMTKDVLARAFLPERRARSGRFRLQDWGLPGSADIVSGRWTRKEER